MGIFIQYSINNRDNREQFSLLACFLKYKHNEKSNKNKINHNVNIRNQQLFLELFTDSLVNWRIS